MGIVHYHLSPENYITITLNRPEKRNAINLEMAKQLKHLIIKAKSIDIKFLVLTGKGESVFCAGGDLTELHQEAPIKDDHATLHVMKEVLYELSTFPVPTICLLNGHALGGGCEVATACDFRIAKEATKFGFIQGSLGIVPAWGGATLLYKKVDSSFAYRWLVESNVYEATYLKNKGWIDKIVPNSKWSKKDDLLRLFKEKSIEQMRLFKAQYHQQVLGSNLASEIDHEVKKASYFWASKKHKEATIQFKVHESIDA